MSSWTPQELDIVDRTDEVHLASSRPDGSLRPAATIWGVHVGGDVFVRSAYGPSNGWFRRAQASGSGQLAVGDVERDVTFERASDDVHQAVDAAYHAKYDGRYAASIVGTVVGPDVREVTLRVVPRD